jgi:Tfp pilus assembly protein PilF
MRRTLRLGGFGCSFGMFARSMSIAGLALGFALQGASAKDCSLKRLMESPILSGSYARPVISILLDDKPRKVLLDTGGFWSIVSPDTSAGLTRYRSPVTGGLGLRGRLLSEIVKMSLQLGPAKATDVEFFVGPEGYMTDVDATLGANWLAQFDVEIDPVKNTASLFSQDHCEGQVVYWPHQDYAEVPFELARYEHRITLPLVLSGKKVSVLLDTGAPESVLSLSAAKRLFDLTPDSPGMQSDGFTTDDRGRTYKKYRYQFASLDMGDISFRNPWISIAELVDQSADMVLGMHQLGALHLYFAYDERKLYATTARGDIAAAGIGVTTAGGTSQAARDPLTRINAQNLMADAAAKLQKGDRDGAMAAVEGALKTDPQYSDGYRMRAYLHAEHGERDLANKDYAHALELDPGNLDVYADRAEQEWNAGDKAQAMGDVSLALGRDPNFLRGYALRASFEMQSNNQNGALTDAGQIIRIQPKNSRGYQTRAMIYVSAGDYLHAYEDQTVVVKLEPKSAVALNNRCWFGAILGKLDEALDDCDAALEIDPKGAAALDSRAFIRFKMGQWDRAISDYSSALQIKSDLASSLYGRGLAKQQKGDKAGGDADIAAARMIDKEIAQRFGK